MQKLLLPILALGALASAGETKIGIIDCEPQLIYKCTIEKCEKIPVVNVDGSQHFEINTKKQTLVGKIGETKVDIEHIAYSAADEKALVYYGLKQDTTSYWILHIFKKDGKMTIASVNGVGESYTVFGTCSWEEEK